MSPSSPLDQTATPAVLRRLAHAGLLGAPALARALELADARPTAASWARFARSRLLLVGAVLTAVGVVFFVAANWAALGPFVRMGLVAGAMAVATAAAAVLGLDTLGGRTAALLAGLLFGPLAALYGQTYQTGADAWSLFATWALVTAVYALGSRFIGAWVLALVLFHGAALLWWNQSCGGDLFTTRALPVTAALALADALLVAAAESRRVPPWIAELSSRVGPRTAAALGVGVLTATGLAAVVESGGGWMRALSFVAAGAAVAGLVAVYRRLLPDPFMLVLAAASLCTLLSTLWGRVLLDWMDLDDAAGVLLLGLGISAQVALAARWLLGHLRRQEAA